MALLSFLIPFLIPFPFPFFPSFQMSSINRFREAVECHMEWKSIDASIRETVWATVYPTKATKASVGTKSRHPGQKPLLNKREIQKHRDGVTGRITDIRDGVTGRITDIQAERIHYCGSGCDEDTAPILEDLDKQEALARLELTALRILECVLEDEE